MTTEEIAAYESRLQLQDQRIQSTTVVIGGVINDAKKLQGAVAEHDVQLRDCDLEMQQILERLHRIEQRLGMTDAEAR